MDAVELIDVECDLTSRDYWEADLVIEKWWQWCARQGHTIVDNTLLGLPIRDDRHS
jgi:hypothetical protein